MFSMFCFTLFIHSIFTASCLAETLSLRGSIRDRITSLSAVDRRARRSEVRFLPPVSGGNEGGIRDDLHLLDIVLVASVDGKFHALNRTSGRTIWTMSSTGTSSSVPSALDPLVRTTHPEFDPDLVDDDSGYQEMYIIEPQSGDIYVMSSPTSPLQRLAFSVPQLVDISPFELSGDEDTRIFVGRKETSLLLIELETGKIKATLNSECPWDPFDRPAETEPVDVDLDELEGSKPSASTSKPTEVYIGRTDYHISIYTRPANPARPRPPVQNLSFSTYGPNNQDGALQAMYRRTGDNTYVQTLSRGEVISFKVPELDDSDSTTMQGSQLLWAYTFNDPVVAIFDVVRTVGRQQPFVLLQPSPRLQDVLPDADSAYVGLVEETGSLYALSPDRFPLVNFGSTGTQSDKLLDPAPSSEGVEAVDHPPDTDSIALAKELTEICMRESGDRRCLIGVHPVEASSQSRFSRLLDATPALSSDRGSSISSNSGVSAADTHIRESTQPWHSELSLLSLSAILADSGPLHVFWAMLSFLCVVLYTAWKVTQRKTTELATATEPPLHVLPPASTETLLALPDDIFHLPLTNDISETNEIPLPKTERIEESNESSIDKPLPSLPSAPTDLSSQLRDGGNDGEESDKDGDVAATPGKRKGLRRRRGRGGKGKKGSGPNAMVDGADAEADGQEKFVFVVKDPSEEKQEKAEESQIVYPITPKQAPAPPSLVVSDNILGFGSHGTVVFQGSLQGRAVAVKRLLQDFVTLAAREVSILQESDDHPNVIRYYYQEAHANFLYIALELCPASLADIIESPDQFRDISISFDPKRALRQIASGLRHLHSLKIIHRDIKPQNILISSAKRGQGRHAGHRMLISDFGLCKKLDVDQTSFLPTAHGAMAAGTVGWRAPEILRGEVKLDESLSDDQSQSSRGSAGTPTSSSPNGKPTRLTKSVDIFAMGCLFYYTLTSGGHPFGDRFEREMNILKDNKRLDGVDGFGEEGSEAADLITAMLNPEAYLRPDTTTCLLHPYFWDPGRRLTFLQDASDRFEIMCREPRDHNLIALEANAIAIVGNDWHSRLDKVFIENLGKFRKYDGRSVQDLLRALRNKKHHYQDLPDNVKRHLGSMPEGFLTYFTRRFPRLFLHVHSVVAASPLRHESMFRSYFELTD